MLIVVGVSASAPGREGKPEVFQDENKFLCRRDVLQDGSREIGRPKAGFDSFYGFKIAVFRDLDQLDIRNWEGFLGDSHRF